MPIGKFATEGKGWGLRIWVGTVKLRQASKLEEFVYLIRWDLSRRQYFDVHVRLLPELLPAVSPDIGEVDPVRVAEAIEIGVRLLRIVPPGSGLGPFHMAVHWVAQRGVRHPGGTARSLDRQPQFVVDQITKLNILGTGDVGRP
jgi:hypothetical protein